MASVNVGSVKVDDVIEMALSSIKEANELIEKLLEENQSLKEEIKRLEEIVKEDDRFYME